MRKTISLILFGLLMVSMQVVAQSPLMGYDQIAWGASVDDVRRMYNLEANIALKENYNSDSNIAGLTQMDVSESIKNRIFLFNKWDSNEYKLYRVWVYYKDTSDNTASTLRGIVENNFGRQTDANIQSGTKFANYVLFTTTTYIFSRYSPDLVVELIHTKAQSISATDMFAMMAAENTKSLGVCYTWKKFRDEYQASKLDL
jgi:hypothetical protein